jgi:hypothetical protein
VGRAGTWVELGSGFSGNKKGGLFGAAAFLLSISILAIWVG